MVVGTTIVGNPHIKDLDLSESFKVFCMRQRWRKKSRSGNPYGGLELNNLF